jgi:hypothetical protein
VELTEGAETGGGPRTYDGFADGDGLLAYGGEVAGECEGADAGTVLD